MNQLSIAEWAYMAGILDGEGCIGLYRYSTNKAKALEARPAAARVVVGNTSHKLLLWIQERFGGKISAPKNRGVNSKPILEWHLSGPDTKPLLMGVLPYLVLKRTQAEVVIRYETARLLEREGTSYVTGMPKGGFSPQFQQLRNDCVAQIRVLNKRGRISL